jgi:hypothetical protein
MITSKIKTALTSAGCTLVLYESDKMSDIKLDVSKPADVIGLIIQPNSINFEPKGNGVHVHYPPLIVEILKQVKPEDTAENNEVTLNEVTEICRKFIMLLIKAGDYKKITNISASKVQESKYDANVIGWALPLDLFYLENKNNC